MKQVQNDNVSGILIQKRGNIIRKELIRKSIHLFSGFIPLFLGFARVPILCALCAVSVFYCIAEILRLKGKKVPVFSIVTETAARKRDQNRFVLGPLALAVGILLTAVFFDSEAAAIGIYALAFGDGLASLAGILFGKHVLPFTAGKTLEGSLTCFAA
ncbi:MAG: phosphatidate cytidylyltransferase, partial [Spirochaetales bacterium]